MLVEVVKPVDRVAKAERLVRADEQLSFVLVILGWEVTCGSLAFVTVQVLLNVFVDKQTTLLD